MTLPQFLQVILAAIFSVYPTPAPTPTPKTVEYDNAIYSYAIFTSEEIDLIPNWERPEPFKKLIFDNKCKYAINGGFYDTNSKPIGLVIADNKILNPGHNNYLFNGYLSNLGIESVPPSMASWSIQTGPVLIKNGQTLNIKTGGDKLARRGVAITTKNNQQIFVIFFNSQALVLGPHLNDLPKIIQKLAETEKFEIKDAINLDGGQASAFYDGKLILEESDPVGTILCAK